MDVACVLKCKNGLVLNSKIWAICYAHLDKMLAVMIWRSFIVLKGVLMINLYVLKYKWILMVIDLSLALIVFKYIKIYFF